MDRLLPTAFLLLAAHLALGACSRSPSSSKATPAPHAEAGAHPRHASAQPVPSAARSTPSLGDSQPSNPPPSKEEAREATLLQWTHSSPSLGLVPVVARVPAGAVPEGGHAVLVAFHGRGESKKSPPRGAHGWITDYHLEDALRALAAPPLSAADLGGLVSNERLAQLNAELERHPLQEPVLVFPYVPDRFKREELFENGPEMARLVVEEIIPHLQKEVPGVSERWGVDGVSLGGRVALLVGLTYPTRFVSVASTQAALDESELSRLVTLAERAQRAHPAPALRVLTSDEDYFLQVLTDFSKQLKKRGVTHHFDLATGDHSYAFNRGPAGVEMLTFFSRQLETRVRPLKH